MDKRKSRVIATDNTNKAKSKVKGKHEEKLGKRVQTKETPYRGSRQYLPRIPHSYANSFTARLSCEKPGQNDTKIVGQVDESWSFNDSDKGVMLNFIFVIRQFFFYRGRSK